MTKSARALSIVNRFYPNVRMVKDAPRDMEIEVTQRDLNLARVRNHKECALAVACKRQLGGAQMIVSRSRAYVIKKNTAIRYELPDTVSREIVAFDRGAFFAAGQYKLGRIVPSHSYAATKAARNGNGNGATKKGKSKKTRSYHFTGAIRSSVNHYGKV